jgi:hypothetical protein
MNKKLITLFALASAVPTPSNTVDVNSAEGALPLTATDFPAYYV